MRGTLAAGAAVTTNTVIPKRLTAREQAHGSTSGVRGETTAGLI